VTQVDTGCFYTDAKKNKDITWGEDTLMEYLENPKSTPLEQKLSFLALRREKGNT
jgi:cytochrome c